VACGGTVELNRIIMETPEIDILLNHDISGQCGINHVLARIAKKNGVAIGFDFNQLMTSYRLGRVQEFSAMVETARMVRKFKAPYVLTSGAMDPWDMRSPSELIAMGRLLGFSEGEARKGLSDHIVRENRKRLSGKWVMPGVEIE
jgi:ribonuclease P/MRP protein subunit RPP1